ncbi:enoyl-CoA hydratase/isomerase family protein [Ferrovibrio sp.]|uniref:enoyl-CoA hydratase/isomerase family protein n=1 Tax=Ferrovibrio sp. TaxID=1917215 RepID=UPI003D142E55
MSQTGHEEADLREFSSQTRPDGVAIITFNMPERLNPLGPEGLRDLALHLEALATDAAVSAIVLTGKGKAFCSGAGLDRLLDLMGSGETEGLPEPVIRNLFDTAVNPIQRAIARMPKPVVTAINGVAAGGGVGLALAGDVVLAAESASFRLTFVPNLAIVPDLGASWFFSRLAGRGRALAAMMTGDAISAREALEWGLIWRIEPEEKLLDAAIAMGLRLAAGPRHMYPLLRGAVDEASRRLLSDQLDLERDINVELCGTAEFAEGVRAFLEKRRPRFQ